MLKRVKSIEETKAIFKRKWICVCKIKSNQTVNAST